MSLLWPLLSWIISLDGTAILCFGLSLRPTVKAWRKPFWTSCLSQWQQNESESTHERRKENELDIFSLAQSVYVRERESDVTDEPSIVCGDCVAGGNRSSFYWPSTEQFYRVNTLHSSKVRGSTSRTGQTWRGWISVLVRQRRAVCASLVALTSDLVKR